MRIPSWLTPWRQARRAVAGMAIGLDGVDWVVMTGSSSAPDGLCCAERLDVPAWMHHHAKVLDAQALGHWLRAFLRARDHQVDGIGLSVEEAWLTYHELDLAQGLQGDDLHFQLLADLRALYPQGLSELCVAYECLGAVSVDDKPATSQRYRVAVIARERIDALEQMARHAGLQVLAIEPSAQAVRRTQDSAHLSALPVASAALGLQCEAALGVALGAWSATSLSFSPSRQQQARRVRHTLWTQMATRLGAGALLGSVLAVCLSFFAVWQDDGADAAATVHALDTAKQEALAAQAQWQQSHTLAHWLRTQTTLQQHTVQWSRVLSQEAHGVWVSEVQQRDGHWVVQGEALSSAHVHHLLQQLKALDIWAQAPRALRMQFTHAASARAMSTWQFRIEADLKASL